MREADTVSNHSDAVQGFLDQPLGMVIGEDISYIAASGATLDVLDPSTESLLARVPSGDTRDVDTAVASSLAAFEDGRWTSLAPSTRAEVLWRLADLIDRDAPALAELDALDVGTPISQTAKNPASAASTLRYYAGWCTKIYGSVNPVDRSLFGYTEREPVGVTAGIGAWNSPLVIAASKSGPALAAGNTSVLKPAEQAPLSTLWYARLAMEAGVPPGVINVVTGTGPDAGAPLVEHDAVSLVSFTGSVDVGKDIHRRANAGLKDVVLELGGKSPNIVFSDADVAAAAQSTAKQMCSNAAQVCFTGSRVLVHRLVARQFVDEVTKRLSDIRIGPATARSTELGPLVSAAQKTRVEGFLDAATAQGATAATGGKRREGPGYFVNPTLLTGVANDMTVAREEIFGPIIGVLEFDDDHEAIAMANDTRYGLAAGIWTSDLKRAHRTARALRAGTVWVNTYGILDRSAPSGGYKMSGMGREHGDAWLHHFTGYKSVYIDIGDDRK